MRSGLFSTASRLAAMAALVAAFPAFAEEQSFASAVGKSAHSSARLLAAGPSQGGVYHAGVEIDLEPKTITYWRSPGEAGSPPVFDFSHSENVAAVEPSYPAPKHIEEEGSVVAGYDARVIFPLRVTPRDPKAPVTLKLSFDYAACGKICLPAKATLALTLPMAGVSPHAAEIAAAEKQVPRKLSEAEAGKLIAIEPRGGGEKRWSVRYLGAGQARDLFAEVPEPLFLESKRAADAKSFELTLSLSCCSGENEKKPPQGAQAVLTLVTDQGAIEAPATLK